MSLAELTLYAQAVLFALLAVTNVVLAYEAYLVHRGFARTWRIAVYSLTVLVMIGLAWYRLAAA